MLKSTPSCLSAPAILPAASTPILPNVSTSSITLIMSFCKSVAAAPVCLASVCETAAISSKISELALPVNAY